MALGSGIGISSHPSSWEESELPRLPSEENRLETLRPFEPEDCAQGASASARVGSLADARSTDEAEGTAIAFGRFVVSVPNSHPSVCLPETLSR